MALMTMFMSLLRTVLKSRWVPRPAALALVGALTTSAVVAALGSGSPAHAATGASAAVSAGHAVAVGAAQTRSQGAKVQSRVIPAIRWKECTGQTTTWVDLDEVNIAASVIDDWCYSATGWWKFPKNPGYYISHICAGNNYGEFIFFDHASGKVESWQFAPGHQMAGEFTPIALNISGWAGNDTCRS